jgi:hypothetical protein
MQQERIICWFSCGAASAVATKLAIEENARGRKLPLVVARIHVKDEDDDNDRFAVDCEKWFGVPIVTLKNAAYEDSVDKVIEIERYMAGIRGAACTRLLKKSVRLDFEKPSDIQVFGYTCEEQNQVDKFLDANAHVRLWPILIEKSLLKTDCMAMLQRAGIELPRMYQLGYGNNNCKGCLKGGAGYWNKIRIDFPDVFQKRAQQSRALGVRLIKVNQVRVFLDELPLNTGDFPKEPKIECGIFCEIAEKEISSY